jgi:hypothetical protein
VHQLSSAGWSGLQEKRLDLSTYEGVIKGTKFGKMVIQQLDVAARLAA